MLVALFVWIEHRAAAPLLPLRIFRLPTLGAANVTMAIVGAATFSEFFVLTLYLQDETFIKIKPTIIYVLFGAILLGGQIMGKPLLAMVFDQVFHLNPEGWRKLTMRWGIFFFALAVLNEIVWRTQTTDTWVAFKVFGFMPLTFIFAAAQYPLLQKYAVKESASDA